MLKSIVMTGLLLAVAGTPVGASAADRDLHAALERVAQRRIFFGHQSVGMNVLDGVRDLAAAEGVSLRIVEAGAADTGGRAAFEHAFIAENGNPALKLQSFAQTLARESTRPDVALMKFCYVDFDARTDARGLFARYQVAVEALRARYPGMTMVHVTAPLTTAQSGFKAWVKRLIGRAPYGSAENVRREQYNTLLRAAYQGREPIFDLARVESTAPDGTAVTVEWEGSVAPAMAPIYTDDGGHLNAAGRMRAARELLLVLAAAASREPRH